mgnify:CR=1 FL=1
MLLAAPHSTSVGHKWIPPQVLVKRTKLPSKLKPLRKKLDQFRNACHEIVHRGFYQEPDLYRLELYSCLEETARTSGYNLPNHLSHVPEARIELTREFVRDRKAKYIMGICIFWPKYAQYSNRQVY